MDELKDTFALLLDGTGGARALSLEEVPSWRPSDGVLWLHLPPDLPDLPRALEGLLPLPSEVRDSFLAEVNRVRIEVFDGEQILLLMQHPDALSADAPQRTLRAWVSAERCITVARTDQPAVLAMRHKLEQGRGPHASDLLLAFGGAAITEAALRLTELDDTLSELESRFEGRRDETTTAGRLRQLRRGLVEQRRFVSLARDALVRVSLLDVAWLRAQGEALRQGIERAKSVLKELDALIERARILHEDEKARQDDKSQRILYLLTIISGIFLPLSFITGLLGVNLGGIPGTRWHGSFLLLVVVLAVIALVEWRSLRRREFV